jgi:hypothetical protein
MSQLCACATAAPAHNNTIHAFRLNLICISCDS